MNKKKYYVHVLKASKGSHKILVSVKRNYDELIKDEKNVNLVILNSKNNTGFSQKIFFSTEKEALEFKNMLVQEYNLESIN